MVDQHKIETAVRMILEAVGEDPEREGLIDTPRRVAKMYEEMFSGLREDPKTHLQTVFTEDHEELVLVKDITFYSMCEHHLVPFYGKAHIAYLPNEGKVTGLSKLARTVDGIARQPQVQERMTKTLADALEETLGAKGVMVIVSAEHMCMSMRGIKKPGSKTVTTAVRGVFKDDAIARQEVLSLI
ncbi:MULTISPECIES: GTP cyclohydrolase I FolE [Shouchella]|uniref:GTP cyclohydrolase 1 n=2 Tax=Shouchella TaxID=2893057 RepID=A0ABY7W6T0_9BACI|nr:MULTISPECIES: GTP cyclohydrolase I FolE [Shouchella]MED4127080.1 GTP cyclohydrolase I FolE [Shouchella miscanthi]WDF03567.1 GTP cyclohydrolase I FolE [Shouchella hunanensis]